MCEYCNIDDEELTKLDQGEENPRCEYGTEERGLCCGNSAQHCSKFRYLDDHLCEKHLYQIKKEYEEGLMEFQQSLGFSTGFVIKKIGPGDICDYTPPLDLTQTCGKPALYASINTALSYFCDEHKSEKEKTSNKVTNCTQIRKKKKRVSF